MTFSSQQTFNTSSLALTRIAEEMERQERLQGSTIAYLNAFKVSQMVKGSTFPVVHPNKGSSKHFHSMSEIERRRLLANPSEIQASSKLAASVSALVRTHMSAALKASTPNSGAIKCTRSFEECERDRRMADNSESNVRRVNAQMISKFVQLNGSSVRARLIKRKNLSAELYNDALKSLKVSTRLPPASPEVVKSLINKHQHQLRFKNIHTFCPVFIGPEPLVPEIIAKELLPPTPAAPALHAQSCCAPPSPFALSPNAPNPVFASPAITAPAFASPALLSTVFSSPKPRSESSSDSKGNKIQKRQRVRAAVSRLRTHLHQHSGKYGKGSPENTTSSPNIINNSNINRINSPRVQLTNSDKLSLSPISPRVHLNNSAKLSPPIVASGNDSNDWMYRVKGLPTPAPLSPSVRRISS